MSIVATPLAAAPLHARRCVRHSGREAAARCPACGEFFCRECVVEHEGRLLCSGCLARGTVAAEQRRQRWAGIRAGATSVLGAVLLWIAFALLGALLLRIPPKFHDGAAWSSLLERRSP